MLWENLTRVSKSRSDCYQKSH